MMVKCRNLSAIRGLVGDRLERVPAGALSEQVAGSSWENLGIVGRDSRKNDKARSGYRKQECG